MFDRDTQAIIDRLAAIDRVHPIIDRDRVEQAITAHFHAFGVSPLPVRWARDAKEGYLLVESAAWVAARSATENAAWVAARGAAENAAWNAAWVAARSATESAAWGAARSAAWNAAWSAAWGAARSAAWNAAWSAAENAAWNAAWVAARSATWNAAWSAAESAAWVAAWVAARGATADKLVGIWLPFVEASEAGLWMFWVLEHEVIAIPRPSLEIVGDQLHCDHGPAVSWPHGEQYWFLHGVNVPQFYVETPSEHLDPQLILQEANAERRRELVRKIGIERVLYSLHAMVLDRQGDYELLSLRIEDGRERPYLKMKNPSVPGLWHVEGVGAEVLTEDWTKIYPEFRRGSVGAALHYRKPDAMRRIPVRDDGEPWYQQGDVYVWPAEATALQPYPSILT